MSEGRIFCKEGAMVKKLASLDPTNCSFFFSYVMKTNHTSLSFFFHCPLIVWIF